MMSPHKTIASMTINQLLTTTADSAQLPFLMECHETDGSPGYQPSLCIANPQSYDMWRWWRHVETFANDQFTIASDGILQLQAVIASLNQQKSLHFFQFFSIYLYIFLYISIYISLYFQHYRLIKKLRLPPVSSCWCWVTSSLGPRRVKPPLLAFPSWQSQTASSRRFGLDDWSARTNP